MPLNFEIWFSRAIVPLLLLLLAELQWLPQQALLLLQLQLEMAIGWQLQFTASWDWLDCFCKRKKIQRIVMYFCARLKTVYFNLVLWGNLFASEKLLHFESLVSAQLNDTSVILIVHQVSITSKLLEYSVTKHEPPSLLSTYLLESLEDSLLIQLFRKALDSCNRFSSVSLLNTDIYKWNH